MTLDQYKRHFIELLNHSLKKSFIDYFIKARYDVGTVRTWGDKKYKKINKDKWVRFYEGESRGKNQAVKNVIRKIQNAKNITELAEIIKANKNTFKDENGNIDNVVKQLLDEAKGKRPEKVKEEKVIDNWLEWSIANPKYRNVMMFMDSFIDYINNRDILTFKDEEIKLFKDIAKDNHIDYNEMESVIKKNRFKQLKEIFQELNKIGFKTVSQKYTQLLDKFYYGDN